MFCYECSPTYAFGNFIMAMPVTYCPIINLNNCVGWRHMFINSSGQEQNRKPAVRGPRLFPFLYAPFVRLYKQRTSRDAIYDRFGHKNRWCHSMPSEGAPKQAFRGCTARSFQGCHFAAPVWVGYATRWGCVRTPTMRFRVEPPEQESPLDPYT